MMERLTRAHYKASDGHYLVCSEMCEREDCTEECGHFDEAIERLADYEDTGLSPQACVEAREIEAGLSAEDYSIHRMVELMRADKDGRLAVLPCKIGGTVYLLLQDDVKHNPETCGWYISEDRVGAIAEGGFYLGDPADDVYVRNEEIGEEVFLTREGAERALEGRK
mgnify:CR=1 FL=1